jgi:hypothetical protein
MRDTSFQAKFSGVFAKRRRSAEPILMGQEARHRILLATVIATS